MRNIVIKLHRAADISGTMKAMRVWLDDHRCQPDGFTCDHLSGWHVIHADFDEDDRADAFKACFGGSGEKSAQTTMSKVCWWRLMAEEIRTEADGFSSASAKAYDALRCANARSDGDGHGAMVGGKLVDPQMGVRSRCGP